MLRGKAARQTTIFCESWRGQSVAVFGASDGAANTYNEDVSTDGGTELDGRGHDQNRARILGHDLPCGLGAVGTGQAS